MKKNYRIALLGATGVTGQNTFRHLAENLPVDFRWAIAGRDVNRLEQLISSIPNSQSKPDRLYADLFKPQSIDALIKDCDVVIHLAGPYAAHGEQFFASCVAHSTHYVDIGGETFFIKRMIAKYHDQARQRGVVLLPTAGYESVPFDLLTRLAVEHACNQYGEGFEKIKIITSFHRTGVARDNRISGGSLGTMRNILEGDDCNAFNDMACLLPPARANDAIRRRNRVRYAAHYDKDVEAHTGPLQPAPFLNVPVILRSAFLLGEAGIEYGTRFSYQDAMTMEFYANTVERQKRAARRSARINRLTSIAMAGPRPLRSLIRRRLDRLGIGPGDGPSQESLPFVDYELRLFGSTDTGRPVRAHAAAKGHPGYLSTSRIVAEAGRFLTDTTVLPPEAFGVTTPATALGLGFLPYLKRAGVTLEILDEPLGENAYRPGGRLAT